MSKFEAFYTTPQEAKVGLMWGARREENFPQNTFKTVGEGQVLSGEKAPRTELSIILCAERLRFEETYTNT